MQKGFYRQTFPARVGCSHWCSALLTAVHLHALIIPVITRCFLESAFFFFFCTPIMQLKLFVSPLVLLLVVVNLGMKLEQSAEL